jgi:hypothetical protein
MTPTPFKQQNIMLTAPANMTEEECSSLPVWSGASEGVQYTISCWRLSLWERIKFMFHGNVWLYVWAGGRTQPPVALTAKRTVF